MVRVPTRYHLFLLASIRERGYSSSMDFVLITIWILVPGAFFLMALWSYLEQSTQIRKGKKRSEEPRDLFKQAIFLSGCSVLTYLLDHFLIQSGSLDFLFGEWTPKPMLRLFLYPLILYIGAISLGQTKRPSIERLPRPSEKYKYKK